MKTKASSHAAGEEVEMPTTDDAFLGGQLHILQPVKGARAGVDAVALAAAVPAQAGAAQRVLEAGAGVGVVSLALARRVPTVRVTAVEIEPALCALARKNARRNDLHKRVEIIEEDVTAPFARLARLGVQREAYDHVISNPPFYCSTSARQPQTELKRRAHVGGPDMLDAWLRFMTACAAPGGTLTLIHRADALPDLLRLLDGRFGGLTVFPLYPRESAAAGRVIIRGTKGSRAAFRLLHGAVVHRQDGSYTPELEAVLRHGASLDIS